MDCRPLVAVLFSKDDARTSLILDISGSKAPGTMRMEGQVRSGQVPHPCPLQRMEALGDLGHIFIWLLAPTPSVVM